MRMLKFRAWDNLKKKWMSNIDLWRMKFDDNGIGTIAPPAIYFKQHPDGLTIQQFTGLLDKNNKEIFEGDILRCKTYDGWFDKEGGYFNSEVKFVNCSIREYYASGWRISHNMAIPVDCEIVGNIFENPELIKS